MIFPLLCASFAAILTNLKVIRDFVEKSAHYLQVPKTMIDDVVQAVDEAVTNIILHGYAGQEGMVDVELERQGQALFVRLRDQAPLFDPTTIPSPDLSLSLEQRRPGGLGIYLIRQLTDQIQYHSLAERGNELTLVKLLSREENN